MSNVVIILIALATFMILLVTGHYISTVIFGASMLGLYIIGGWNMSLLSGNLINDPYASVASYTISTIPMFVLMSQFIMRAGIVRDCYALIFKVSKGRKGVLGMLTVLLGGFLGAVSGSGTATSASLGQISVPELRSKGYSDALAGSVASVSGSLSAVIPPSLILIIYGQVAQQSVGALFMATLIPGILIMLIYIVLTFILLQTKSEKEQLPDVEAEVLEITRGRSIFVVVIGVALMASIFGGIYTGVFTPTESGAVGAFLGLICTFVTGTFNFKMLRDSLIETVKVTGMTAAIMMAAGIFSRFVTRSLLPRLLMSSLQGLIDHRIIMLLLLGVLYFVLYMFIDGSAAVLMTMPVLLPILQQMNVDLLWFGIFVSVLCTLGMLTPPVGMCVFSVAGVSSIPMEKIFPKALLFAVVTMVIIIPLMMIFPGIVTWLPSTM